MSFSLYKWIIVKPPHPHKQIHNINLINRVSKFTEPDFRNRNKESEFVIPDPYTGIQSVFFLIHTGDNKFIEVLKNIKKNLETSCKS